jgi:hypothetical protein
VLKQGQSVAPGRHRQDAVRRATERAWERFLASKTRLAVDLNIG